MPERVHLPRLQCYSAVDEERGEEVERVEALPCRRMRSLKAVPKGSVFRVGEPVGSVSLQGREFPD